MRVLDARCEADSASVSQVLTFLVTGVRRSWSPKYHARGVERFGKGFECFARGVKWEPLVANRRIRSAVGPVSMSLLAA